MNKTRFEEVVSLGDMELKKRNYQSAFEHYEIALTTLVSDNIKDKRSKALGSFAGWTAGFLSGGLGLEDLIIIPGVSKGVAKVLGVDDDFMNIAIQALCMREIDCLLQSQDIRASIPKDVALQRFALLLKASNPNVTNLEKFLDLFVPEMAQKNPFDLPELGQSPIPVLLEEVPSE